MSRRKASLVAAGVAAVVLGFASTAYGCVMFMGQMTVDGHNSDTTVVGTGNSHGYCSTGRPTTAAAGNITKSITATVSPATCNDSGAAGNHQLPDGSYEVRYNNAITYNFDGTYFNMIPGSGCFRSANAATTTTIGSFNVSSGNGSWTGTLGDPAGVDVFHGPATAANFCIGDPESTTTGSGGFPGLLAPYRLLAL